MLRVLIPRGTRASITAAQEARSQEREREAVRHVAFGAALTISDLVASRSAFAETGSLTAWSWRGKKGLVNLRRREATRDDTGALQPLPGCIGTGRLLDETGRLEIERPIHRHC